MATGPGTAETGAGGHSNTGRHSPPPPPPPPPQWTELSKSKSMTVTHTQACGYDTNTGVMEHRAL